MRSALEAKYYTGHPSEVNRVVGSVWRDEDDDLLLSVLNWWDDPEFTSFRFRFADYDLERGKAHYLLELVDGRLHPRGVYLGDFNYGITVDGRTLRTYILTTDPPVHVPGSPHNR